MTFNEITTEVLVRLGKDTTSAWTSDTNISNWVNQAHKWAAGFRKWPFTEGRCSTTFTSLVESEDGYLRGDYPEGWKSDSIRTLTIGGKSVQKTQFSQFLRFLEASPQDNERIFTDFGRNYYVNPRIDLSGTVTAWGQYTPANIGETELTVFVGEDEGNQAIIEEAVSYALRRDNKLKEAQEHHERAMAHLQELFTRIGEEQFGYHPTDTEGMWKRVDAVNGDYFEDTLKRDQF